MPVTYPLTENPKSMTALEVVDALNARCVALVVEVNPDRKMTAEQFAATVARTFEAALSKFLERLPTDTRARFEAALLQQYSATYCNQ
ncbi:hypothetical protein [Nocardia sp. NBC_01388]|uniref:hypothetical protein n=1 Tax=Nocardia sp. NBC_01388 TaxID=2903596 RepID=UPI002F916C6E